MCVGVFVFVCLSVYHPLSHSLSLSIYIYITLTPLLNNHKWPVYILCFFCLFYSLSVSLSVSLSRSISLRLLQYIYSIYLISNPLFSQDLSIYQNFLPIWSLPSLYIYIYIYNIYIYIYIKVLVVSISLRGFGGRCTSKLK